MLISVYAFAAMLTLTFLRVPIAFAMAIVGFFGFAMMVSFDASLAMAAQATYETGLTYELAVLPLFVLMGNLVTRSGFSRGLYESAYAFFGHFRGGLAMATVVACGGFSAVCGSSLATAATMVKVALPPMRKYKYADSLAAGSIAGGGTLGILIPPSVIMVIYGVITETNIGKLFIAGIIPGIIAIGLFLVAISIVTYFKPSLGPAGEHTAWNARIKSLREVWGVLVLFGLVMGGIYGGVFTATEAAGVGAGGALLLAWVRRALDRKALMEVLIESVVTTAMMFAVLLGAIIFMNLINLAGMPTALATWVKSLDMSPHAVIIIIFLIYLALGCVLDTLAMVLLTVPAIFPIVTSLGFDAIWFGIFVVIVTEIGMLTPPVGMNVFVIKATMPDVKTSEVFMGVVPFWLAHTVLLMLLIAWPSIVLFLPSFMK
jgi:tripartite ATP-independent transporter DctM subunit